MIKKKIVAVVAAALAACSITATAIATTYTVPKYGFGPANLVEGGGGKTTPFVKKEDELAAWVKVEQGLSSGEAFVTFQVYRYGGTEATPATDLWINGERYLDYYSGRGEIDKEYLLLYYMEPQKLDGVCVSGIWAP